MPEGEATISVAGIEATVTGDGWKSRDKSLRDLLNYAHHPAEVEEYMPDVVSFVAREAARRMKGEIIDITPLENVEGRIY